MTAIRTRRTHKFFTGDPVTREQLELLLELAVWAPNHHKTQPWRFFVVTHERISAFADSVLDAITADAPPKMQAKKPALAEKLVKLGAVVSVGRTPVTEDPKRDREDYAACCCAIHNLTLGAVALGLGSFWSTGATFELPPVRAFLGLPQQMQQVELVQLGVPAREATSERRPAAQATTWV